MPKGSNPIKINSIWLVGKQPPKAILTENPCLTLKPNKKQGFSKGLLQKNRRKKYGQKEKDKAQREYRIPKQRYYKQSAC